MLEIKIKYVTDIKPIEVNEVGDWVDLRSAQDVDLEPFDFAYIPLGVCMQIPKGYTAIVAPRSSTFKKWGVIQTNSVGVIDESYCGDNDQWCMPVLAIRRTHIHKNDRICQFRLIKKTEPLDFTRVKTLGNTDRGGLGSTGVN